MTDGTEKIVRSERAEAEGNNSDKPWEFAGWGHAERITDLADKHIPIQRLDQEQRHMLGPWRATAICGNDITSSCLYVSALCASQAGMLAPLVLLIVAGVLYLFRSVYAEVGSALPLNGGTYTVLLNTTGKRTAAAAACLTILSYIATAVISAGEAMHYAHHLWNGVEVIPATIGLLGLFAFLAILGIGESAVVALAIFVFHMATLTVLAIACASTILQDPSLLHANWQLPDERGIGRALFFGFAAAMLGISGFESSANFIEEQKSGVFPTTLRNMWIAVAIFNPLISFLSLGMLPLAQIRDVPPDLLARMGGSAWGPWLARWISIDAVAVLSGAVLTSFVGVNGLVRRMTLDRCLPQFLLQENPWRKTNHWILGGFFAVCVSILLVTGGHIETLAGVYTLAFLSVMALFAVGNMLLKVKRSRLPRHTRASWGTVAVALLAVVVGLLGNVLLDPSHVVIFGEYYAVALVVVTIMFGRMQLIRGVLFVVGALAERVLRANEAVRRWAIENMDRISRRPIVYFSSGDDLATLNKAALYVLRNEQTKYLKVVHVYENETDVPPQLADHLKTIDRIYPNLRIDFLAVRGAFGPELIEALSRRLKVPKNYMFIGTPGDRFPHRIEDLGGVRLVI